MNYKLPSKINKDNALQCFSAIKSQYSQSKGTFTINASEVQSIDSAGIALILELKSLANTQIVNLSQCITELATLYRLKLED